jgi:DNA modification methylase
MPISLITVGNALNELRKLPSEIVHCCVTSPPYYGLRSYGTEPQVWGGDPNCSHEWTEQIIPPKHSDDGIAKTTLYGGTATQQNSQRTPTMMAECHCGAWRGDLGLEPTPELFIAHLVEVFREVRRVLRKDGTLWLNIGDSYAALGGGKAPGLYQDKRSSGATWQSKRSSLPTGVKPKDLLMIPAQLALALRADGWYLRSEIVWAKKAPMPESVTDRPTCAHEKVFLLSKSARYYYDAKAVKEDAVSDHGSGGTFTNYHKKIIEHSPLTGGLGHQEPWNDIGGKRNMRNVWHLGPEPFPEAHFATFVSEIPRRAILAGTSARGVCPKCGGPWVRVVETDRLKAAAPSGNREIGRWNANDDTGALGGRTTSQTIGWRPSCSCDAGAPIPGTVLDCFLGSGTTALVADQLGRHCIGIELSPQYAAMAERRVRNDAGLFAEIAI